VSDDGDLDVFRLTPSGLVSQAIGGALGSDAGLDVTKGGKYLIAINEKGGATIFDIDRVLSTTAADFWRIGALESTGNGAIETIASPDGHYVFISLEGSGDLAVFNLEEALANGFSSKDFVGTVPLGEAPVGLAVSPNGRYLYATSEGSAVPGRVDGTLTTINLRMAEQTPSRAVVSTVQAGCDPVRVVADRSWVYVTAREGDELLAFSASSLVSDPPAALRNDVQVGEAPVGVALVRRDRNLVVADSNRFGAAGMHANLAVVRIEANGTLTLEGYLPAGSFPRDMAVSPDGKTVIVANYGSGQVETVNTTTIP
jgi:DNA-binding beta-propeller fold protein YncE